jgi:hypothetical protein
MSARRWRRVCTGLYVDPTGRWVVSREDGDVWSIRELVGWGRTLSGTEFPDYSDVWHGDGWSMREVRERVERWSNKEGRQ